MPSKSSILSLAAAVSSAAAFQGFNYGSTFNDGSLKQESDYEAAFTTAQNLEGTNGGFTSARLFTMIQGNTANEPISAIPAAIKTKTSLLFGLWASAGDDAFGSEIAALQNTIDQYCDQLDGLVAGISVGSEDLYRISPTGIANDENPGASPDTLVNYIQRTRDTIKGSCLADVPVGHVDTWTAYVNGTNQPVIDAVDFVGMDAYAYFEDTKPNAIENGAALFRSALSQTQAAAGGKPVWVTETGWPVSGDDFGEAVASVDNAETFYKEVGCPLFGNTNIWWYILQDAAPTTPNPSFGVVGSQLSDKPLFDMSCSNDTTSSSSSSVAQSSTKDSTATATATASASASASATGTDMPHETLPTTAITSAVQSEQPQTTSEDGAAAPTPVPGAGAKMNSLGAAAVAMLVGAVAL
ncbi:glycoside hydrolase superfamily [Emericellopsis atlantica]|uniref:Probable glucan endo-1,3-beta-glucosidase eglC n=1 Tax=Emericellopsis atlantica TaxID=2614577 RepID=A0A9P7ZQV2_9HYPO|nr:glycoside hydrolase superfamily [Emericellopsis atlantica]KAG9256436.1 glycoside hydrolase superfamily [Emericellopsis atlantica]